MPTETPLSNHDPLMRAWKAYKASEDFKNSAKWAMGEETSAAHEAHVYGSLWSAFVAGWIASAVDECAAAAVAAERERLKGWKHVCVLEACCIENGFAALSAPGRQP